MEKAYNFLIADEILALKKAGWEDWPLDNMNVKTLSNIKETKVSFPIDWYNSEAANLEAEGVWAKTRADKILNILNKFGTRVLWEVGAGNGNVSIPLRKNGVQVLCIEPLRSGAENLALNGFEVYLGTLEDLAFPDATIEAIGIFDVLEHLEEPQNVLNEIRRVLKPGGLLITTVPAGQYLFSDFDLSIGHFRRYSRKSLQKLLLENGFYQTQLSICFSHWFYQPSSRELFLTNLRKKENSKVKITPRVISTHYHSTCSHF